MLNHVIEKESVYRGYEYVVVIQKMGHRCGYIAIPQGHFLYGKTAADKRINNISCHGGITFVNDGHNCTYPIDSNDLWWIGFDCMHSFDGRDFEAAKGYYSHDLEALREVEHWEKVFANHPYEAKSLRFCVAECESIIDQIEEMRDNL